MIDAGINNGDIVVIQEQATAQNGDIVVALIEGEEATLKTFRRRGTTIALEAANPAYETAPLPGPPGQGAGQARRPDPHLLTARRQGAGGVEPAVSTRLDLRPPSG